MQEEELHNLLAKHFACETSPDEERKIKAWVQEDPLNKGKYEELKNLWESTTRVDYNWDVDSAWKKISINAPSSVKDSGSVWSAGRIFQAKSPFHGIAALVLLIICGYLLLSGPGIYTKKDNIAWIERATAPGEKAEINLPDKSKIILNGSSRLRYPSRFNNVKREVELEGEAYFEIEHNPDKPFIVYAGDISTTVLGTKFNVSAFKNEKNISVSLIQGKVKISKKESDEEQPIIILKPEQQFVYSRDGDVSTVEQFDSERTIGWKDNILKFDNEPLEQVFDRLERAYGIRFELSAESFKDYKVTANFKNESYQTVTEVLQRLTGLQTNITKENYEVNKIVFEEK